MGWETQLTVDGLMVGLWHKHAPSDPALLFKRTDAVISHANPDDEDEQHAIVWRTSAAEALSNLHASGFSWEHLLSDYAQGRDYSFELAFMKGALSAQLAPAEYAAFLEQLEQHTPADDLRLVALKALDETRALHESWTRDPLGESPPTPIRDALLFYQRTEQYNFRIDRDEPRDVRAILARAADYFVRNQQSAPLVGWAFAMVALLRHTPPNAEVVFDVSSAVGGDPEVYAATFWESAQAGLADVARFYGSIFAGLAAATTDVARAARYGRLDAMLAGASELGISNIAKGMRLEELVAALLELPDSKLPVLEKRLKHADEELDLVLRNDLEEPFWKSFNSPVILVECKNWSSRVDVNELRILETKMRDRNRICSVGIFVALMGFTQPFLSRARDLQGQGLTIFPVDGDDVRNIIQTKQTVPLWLSDKGLRRIL
jgi:hypothetical protein